MEIFFKTWAFGGHFHQKDVVPPEEKQVWYFKLQTNLRVWRHKLALAKIFKNIFTKNADFFIKTRKKCTKQLVG